MNALLLEMQSINIHAIQSSFFLFLDISRQMKLMRLNVLEFSEISGNLVVRTLNETTGHVWHRSRSKTEFQDM